MELKIHENWQEIYSIWNQADPSDGSQSSSSSDPAEELAECLADLRVTLGLNKKRRTPPSWYLCHLCHQHGHYIRDCSFVRKFRLLQNLDSDNSDEILRRWTHSLSGTKTVLW